MAKSDKAKAKTETKAEVAAPAPEGKEAIYIKINDFVKAKTGKRIGKTGGRELFDLFTEEIFALATKDGAFRFNGGFGSMHVRTYGAGTRRLPSGQVTTFGERQKLRYEEGVVVKALVKNSGNLKKALAVRGTRAKPEVPAKEAAKPEAPAKEAAAPEVEEAPSEDSGDDLDLD